MCGITGFFDYTGEENPHELIETMTSQLVHRGPDDKKVFLNNAHNVGLGHTRLAVIDLECGAQPMHSANQRYHIVFNGEIYNYRSLRNELINCGFQFKTNSDTEVILCAYEKWKEDCLSRFHGMFAFAIYDKEESSIFLGRDKVGIKPIYYHFGAKGFYFASELKSLLSVRHLPRRINREALYDYFVFGYPLTPKTLFEDVFELKPGSWLLCKNGNIAVEKYWQWCREEEEITEEDALSESERTLTEAVSEHLVSDVPVGAFLSGGIDSSLLVAIIAKKLGIKLQTFSVRFADQLYDESVYSRLVASDVKTNHTEIEIKPVHNGFELANFVMDQFDQPFADSSAIPTYLISKEGRKHVKVMIGGDGGDEMFGGYPRFRHFDLAKTIGHTPNQLIEMAKRISYPLKWLSSDHYRGIRKLLRSANSTDSKRLLEMTCYHMPFALNTVLHEMPANLEHYSSSLSNSIVPSGSDGGELIDFTINFSLPGDYLKKVDFMSSACGLEVRVPFLGSNVLDLAARLPRKRKYSYLRSKILLRQLADKYLPKEIANGKKCGFSIPIDSWLGKEGRKQLGDVLCSPRANINNLVDGNYSKNLLNGFITQEWDKTVTSRFMLYQRVYMLWSLERWLEKWKPSL